MAKKRAPRRASKKTPVKKRRAARTTSKKAKSKETPSADEYLEQLRALKGVSNDDFAMLGEDVVLLPVKEWIPTGNLAIDKQIGGGWAIGRIIEVAAWEGVGKSTLLDQSIAQVQRMGGIACLIDTEKAREKSYVAQLGVNVDQLIVHEAFTVEEVFDGFEKFLAIQEKMKQSYDQPPPMLIIWDSLGGTPTNAELQGDAGDVQVASAAKVIRRNLRRLAQRIGTLRTSVVISNHFYQNIGGFGGAPRKVAYGGKGVAYFSSLRLELARTGQLKLSDGRVIGHEVTCKIKKTRIGLPQPPVTTGLIYGAGFTNAYALFDWAKGAENPDGNAWVVQNGGHCYLYPPGEDAIHFQRTYYGFGQLLNEHPKIYRAMAKQFLED